MFAILRKTIEPNLSKFSDGRIDGQTDRRIYGREWFHGTLSDKRPASNRKIYNYILVFQFL